MRLTLEIAKSLNPGDAIHFERPGNRNGCERWKVSGNVKTWKRDPSRIRVPLKHGLRSYGAITDSDFDTDGNATGTMANASVIRTIPSRVVDLSGENATSYVIPVTTACEFCNLSY